MSPGQKGRDPVEVATMASTGVVLAIGSAIPKFTTHGHKPPQYWWFIVVLLTIYP